MKKILMITSVIFAMMVSVNILSSQVACGDGVGCGMHGGPGFGPKAMAGKMRRGIDISAETEARVMDIVSKNDPQLASKLGEIKKNFPQKYKQIIRISSNLFDLSHDDDEGVEKDIVKGIALEIDTRELALNYAKAQGSEKEKIKSDIKAKLNELFDIRTKIQELRIKKLESRIKELKADIEKRKQNKSKIVEERLNDLCQDRSLKW